MLQNQFKKKTRLEMIFRRNKKERKLYYTSQRFLLMNEERIAGKINGKGIIRGDLLSSNKPFLQIGDIQKRTSTDEI